MKFTENISYLRYFGLTVTFYKTINKLFHNNYNIRKSNQEVIENFLIKKTGRSFNDLVHNNISLIEQRNNNLECNSIIWTIWWQGEKSAPYIVKQCINSMRKHSDGHRVIVVDKNNFKKYIKLPTYIIKRYETGKKNKGNLKNIVMSNALLSDIIRCGLLASYGGVWADATIFFARDIDNKIFQKNWFTLGQDNKCYIGHGKWSTFFFECNKDNILLRYVFNALCEYWKNNKYYINYLMYDFFIDIACKNNLFIKNMIASSPNSKPLTLNRNYNAVYNESRLEKFILEQNFHKLSYKWWIDGHTPIEVNKGKETVYGYLKRNYFDSNIKY